MNAVALRRKRLLMIGAAAGLVLVLVALSVWWLFPWGTSSADLGPNGGSAWASGRTVGVRAAAGAVTRTTRITFAPGSEHRASPADRLVDVLGDPVDISPDGPIAAGQAQVMFAVPAGVPVNVDCGRPDPHRPRSICNAGVQVFNTVLQGWVPLDSHIENDNLLVADAPHFSEYRLVWTKIGDFAVDLATKVSVHLTPDSTPDSLGARTAGAYLKQLFDSLTGQFDEEKLKDCTAAPAKEYAVDFQRKNDRISACLTRRDGVTKILIKNGWAVPIAFTADHPEGLKPDDSAAAELTTVLRNRLATVGSGTRVIASGLDTAGFLVDEAAIGSVVTVDSEISWAAVAVDFVAASFEIWFPPGRLVKQTGKLIDTVNCLTTGFQKIPEMATGNVPGTLAELLKTCALRGVLEGLGVGELAGALLKEAKLLPEMFQVGQAVSFRARTGQSLGSSSFTVSNPLKALQGSWVFQCGGTDRAIDFLFQGDDSWKVAELGPDNRVIAQYETFFTTELENGHPVLVIGATNLPGVKKGDRLAVTLHPGQGGFADAIVISNNPDSPYFRDGGRSYC